MDLQTIDHLLTTTRSVRKRLDLERPVEREVILKCLEIAIQAPTGSNAQGWHFLVITDAEKRATIADYYKKAWDDYVKQPPPPSVEKRTERGAMRKVVSSAGYLAENLQHVPAMVIPCYEGRVENSKPFMQASLYGSIIPAGWSFMLALRSRGIGSSWTTLHLKYEKEITELLNIPINITQAALIPLAYYTGDDFKPAKRHPIDDLTYWDTWGQN